MSVLDKLKKDRVMAVRLEDNNQTAILSEECDECFCSKLNKKEMGELILELTEIHRKMSDGTPCRECGEKVSTHECTLTPSGGWGTMKCGAPLCDDCKCSCQQPTY